jgi:hypothetical protein
LRPFGLFVVAGTTVGPPALAVSWKRFHTLSHAVVQVWFLPAFILCIVSRIR